MPTKYVSQAQFAARFSQAELDDLIVDATPGQFDDVENDAASLVDGFMGARYTLPLAVVPPLVVGWAADVLRFKLWDQRAPQEVRQRFDDALAQLRDLSRGLIALPPGSDGAQAAPATVVFDGFSATRVFDEDSLRGF